MKNKLSKVLNDLLPNNKLRFVVEEHENTYKIYIGLRGDEFLYNIITLRIIDDANYEYYMTAFRHPMEDFGKSKGIEQLKTKIKEILERDKSKRIIDDLLNN